MTEHRVEKGGGAGDGHHAPLDPGRVDLLNPEEVKYWCAQFECTEDELRHAVTAVGNHAAAVRQEINGPG